MAASGYASGTSVSSEKTRAEIERTLVRFGANEFAYGWVNGQATIAFTIRNLQVLFRLPLPDRGDPQFRLTPSSRRVRTKASAEAAWEQATRESWRALLLILKAKLVAVQSGVVTFEQEFGMHVLLPNGRTVGDLVVPNIEQAYASGELPALMPGRPR
jgi:hypothetical protein